MGIDAEWQRNYRKTYKGCRAHKISEWRTKHKMKHTLDEFQSIFHVWYEAKTCQTCHKEFNKKNFKCLDHHHLSGSYRYVCCNRCNNQLGTMDKLKSDLLLELHRYFLRL
jgi:hypothetical protein